MLLSAKENIRYFMQRVRKTKTCWLWTGTLDRSGYGMAKVPWELKSSQAHRISYRLFCGPTVSNHGLVICHSCDVRNCVNPKHLNQLPPRYNIFDSYRKGRRRIAISEEAVDKIRKLRKDGIGPSKISRMTGIERSQVSRISRNKSYAWISPKGELHHV